MRTHVVTTTEPRTCPQHGAYAAQQLDIQPKPDGYPNLPDHRTVADFLKPFWTKCPACDKVLQDEVDAKEAEIAGGMTQAKKWAMERIREAGIPSRFSEATLWNWTHSMDQQKRVWGWARDYAGSFELAISKGRSAIFMGAPGTGKTHLAIGVLKHILEKGGTGRFTTVMGMLSRIKNTYHRDAQETEAKAIAAFTDCDMLVIDEVGRALDTAYTEAQFFAILNARYNEMRPVILVSNLAKPKLVAFLGDAIVDRMREAGGTAFVFDWASQRSSRRKADDEGEQVKP